MKLLSQGFAAILTLALVLQSACELWCPHLEAALQTELQSQNAPAVTCHGTSGTEESHRQGSDDHGNAKYCFHPQASDDNSKLFSKVVKANQPVENTVITAPEIAIAVMAANTATFSIAPHSKSSSLILRI